MSEYSPVLVAFLFVVACFIFASKKGVVGLLASGTAIAVAMALLLAGFEYLPKLARTYLDVGLDWRFSLAVAGGAALLVLILLRIILAIFFKRLFNPDGWLHRFADGVPGGILSVGPSLVAVFFFFTCIRAAGTVQELNYVDSLARDGIREMGGRIPPYPPSATWRNAIETLPFIAPLLDATDPFSRRSARNAAALVLASEGVEFNNHLRVKPATAALAGMRLWVDLGDQPGIAEALTDLDRLGLVTAPALQAAAADPAVVNELSALVLEPRIKEFVSSLVPPPGTEPAIDGLAPGAIPPVAPLNPAQP